MKKATSEYTQDTQLIKTINLIGKYGIGKPEEGTNTVKVFADNNGYKAAVFYSEMSGDPYKIQIVDSNGNQYKIHNISLRGNYKNTSGEKRYEPEKILPFIVAQIENGASLTEIARNFSECKIRDYPSEINKDVEEQKAINDELQKKFDKLKNSGKYGSVDISTNSGIFDRYKQDYYIGAPTLFLIFCFLF